MKNPPLRQRTRKGLLLLSLLLFPIIMNYFSPYVIIDGAFQGILSGSFIVFGLLFLSSLVVGRLWCGWACPIGGLGAACQSVNNKTVNGRKLGRIKWVIWIPWMAVIAWGFISAGGYQAVDFFLSTEGGISVAGSADRPIFFAYLIYYIVIGLFAGLALWLGRRAGCHSLCWIAPFMILGRKLRNTAGWTSLRLQAEPAKCSGCQACTKNCPMSLEVTRMVQANAMENLECILCGTCIDGCPSKAIHFSFSPGGQTLQQARLPKVQLPINPL